MLAVVMVAESAAGARPEQMLSPAPRHPSVVERRAPWRAIDDLHLKEVRRAAIVLLIQDAKNT